MARRNLSNGEAIPMEPGERNKPVTIQQLTETVGESLRPVEEWVTLDTVWMRRIDIDGDERFKTAQTSGRVDTQWEMGYRADMDPEDVDVVKCRRLLYRDRLFDIRFASVIGRSEGVELVTLSRSGS